jgi:hypothetical protein
MFYRVAAALLGFAAAANASISDCDPTSRFRPTKLALSPDPPTLGQPVLMTVQFENPGAEVVDGTVRTSVTLNFIPFQPTEEPLCTNTQCPIPTGAVDRSTSSTWPDNVSGSVVSKSQWYGPDGESLLCVQTKVAVGSAAPNPRLRGVVQPLPTEFPYVLFSGGVPISKSLVPYAMNYNSLVEYGHNGTRYSV